MRFRRATFIPLPLFASPAPDDPRRLEFNSFAQAANVTEVQGWTKFILRKCTANPEVNGKFMRGDTALDHGYSAAAHQRLSNYSTHVETLAAGGRTSNAVTISARALFARNATFANP
jgi:hypothetical protein